MPKPVPPPTGRAEAFARRRERISLEIERAALELFAEHGPNDVTTEQIAEAAGISVRTFFRYFPTKDDVLAALPRRHNEAMGRRVAARPASESILEAFIGAAHEPLAKAEEEMVRLWGRAISSSPVRLSQGRNSNSLMVGAFAPVIAKRLGVRPNDRRVRLLATAIASATWFAFIEWLEGGAKRPLSKMMEESFDVLAELNRHTGREPRSRNA